MSQCSPSYNDNKIEIKVLAIKKKKETGDRLKF
jgi:hypothetical protein